MMCSADREKKRRISVSFFCVVIRHIGKSFRVLKGTIRSRGYYSSGYGETDKPMQ